MSPNVEETKMHHSFSSEDDESIITLHGSNKKIKRKMRTEGMLSEEEDNGDYIYAPTSPDRTIEKPFRNDIANQYEEIVTGEKIRFKQASTQPVQFSLNQMQTLKPNAISEAQVIVLDISCSHEKEDDDGTDGVIEEDECEEFVSGGDSSRLQN
jgi:hypothetical protein